MMVLGRDKAVEVTVRYFGRSQFEAQARGHRVLCDQPAENAGADAGMTPPELLLASLGTCAGYYAAQYLHARALSSEGLSIHVQADKAAQPARLSAFRVNVIAPYLNERYHAGLLRTVHLCLIHSTLTHPPAIHVTVQAKAVAA